jgi:hypothetical protein
MLPSFVDLNLDVSLDVDFDGNGNVDLVPLR